MKRQERERARAAGCVCVCASTLCGNAKNSFRSIQPIHSTSKLSGSFGSQFDREIERQSKTNQDHQFMKCLSLRTSHECISFYLMMLQMYEKHCIQTKQSHGARHRKRKRCLSNVPSNEPAESERKKKKTETLNMTKDS